VFEDAELTDIGHGVAYVFTAWAPDRELNPQHDGVPDVDRFGLLYRHAAPDGSECGGSVTFDSETARKIAPKTPKWTVESWEPLTLSPSLLCNGCGHHGWIKNGRWVEA
jgi:hypothetical protein